MKESEAKKKKCPMQFHVNTMQMGNCIGGECAMWEVEQVLEAKEKQLKRENSFQDYHKHDADGFRALRIVRNQGTDCVFVEFRRYVDSDFGECGLKAKELYCEGCQS